MPHHARKKSESGYYHVVPKGVANQVIFEDDDDRGYYQYLLADAKRKTHVKIHAYCLMSNHVHLVIEDVDDSLSPFMKSVHVRYGMYFSNKAERRGGVFRKPYWSEPIETEPYLLDAVRYVHANPAAAGLCKASDYEWSSAKDYLGRDGLADVDTVLGMLGGQDGFVEFSKQVPIPAKAFPGSLLRAHLSDDEVVRVVKAALGEEECRDILKKTPEERKALVGRLFDCGLTVRQIVRATGLGYNVVQRIGTAWQAISQRG